MEYSNINKMFYPISVERSKLNKYLSNDTLTYPNIINLCYLLQSLLKKRIIRYCDIIPINTNTNTSVLEYLLSTLNTSFSSLSLFDFYNEIIQHNSDECRTIYTEDNNIDIIPNLITLNDIYLNLQKCKKTGYFKLSEQNFYTNNKKIVLFGYIFEDKNGLFLVDYNFCCKIYCDSIMFPELSANGKNKVLVIINKYLFIYL